MTDHYVWIDPFSEVENAKASAVQAHHQAAWAREQGRNEVMDLIADGEKGRFLSMMWDAVGQACDEFAEEIIKPRIRDDYSEVMRLKQITDRQLRFMSHQIMAPMIGLGSLNLDLSMPSGPDAKASDLRVSVRNVQPYQYTIQIPYEDYR